MSFRRKQQIERKQRKKRLKEKLVMTTDSISFLMTQKKKLDRLPLSEDEKELQLQLIERSMKLETRNKEELERIIDEVSRKVDDI